ncbi:MAG: hypothetical protein WAT66_14535 [Actinomycetota bacterium]
MTTPRRPWFDWHALPPRTWQEGWDWNRYFARHPHLMDFPSVHRSVSGIVADPRRTHLATVTAAGADELARLTAHPTNRFIRKLARTETARRAEVQA